MQYIFNQPGSIPGIPGLFANCIVTVAEDGAITQEPLIVPPHIVEDAPIEADSNATDPELPVVSMATAETALQADTPIETALETAVSMATYSNGG